jgi:general secretion pathway protein A
LRQLAQRITGRYHLSPLSKTETAAYIRHRLKVAGANTEIFTPAALREAHRLSDGIPRIINVICDRALLGAFTQEQHRIGPGLVRAAASEVYGRSFNPPWMRWLVASSAAIGAIVLAFGVWLVVDMYRESSSPPALAAAEMPSEAPTAQPVAHTDSTPPAAEVEPPPDIDTLLDSHADETNTEAAFAQLFALWGGRFDPANGRPCDQALAQGLECVYQQGSWGQLRTLNRPAILTLVDDGGNAHQVVVSRLDSSTAQIKLSSTTFNVPIASISRFWFGDYLVLWRPQVGAPRALSAGMQGEGVLWLRKTLNRIHGRPADEATSDYYDQELVQMVEEFQRRHRLRVDGIAGVQTQIVLDALANSSDAPLLIAQDSTNTGASG